MSKKAFNKSSKRKDEDRKGRHKSAYTYGGSAEDREFEAELSKKGLIVKPMAGDGNCLFRAIADQLGRDVEEHLSIRQNIVDYMKVLFEEYFR